MLGKPFYIASKNAWFAYYTASDGRRLRKRIPGTSQRQVLNNWKAMGNLQGKPLVTSVVKKYIQNLKNRLKIGEVTASHVRSAEIALADAIPEKLRWPGLTPQLMIEHAATKDWAPSTTRTRYQHVKALSNWASEAHGLPHVLAKLKLPPRESREKAVDREEYRAIIKYITRNNRVKDQRIALCLVVMWNTGARPGEIWRAKWADLQGTRIILRKHKTVKKTGKPRIIHLNRVARIAIELCRGDHDEWIFVDARGNGWHKDTFGTRLKRIVRGAKLDDRIVGYSFRHGYATRALKQGANIAHLAELMGTSVEMIEKHYGHLSQQQKLLEDLASTIR